MDAALLHPSRFLKSQEFLGKDVTYTVQSIALEELEDENAQKKVKGLMSFAETPKMLVINRTNSDCIKGMFGRETNNWIGKRITFFPEPFYNRMTKENTTAIRVRGSPDLKEAAVTVTVALPRKKPVQVKMVKTGGAVTALAGDELEQELASISKLIADTEPSALNAAWSGANGLGNRIARLPTSDKEAKLAEFKARRALTLAAAAPEAPPPA